LLGVFDVGQNERRLHRIQHPSGQEHEQTGGGAGDRHVPEILPGAPFGGKPRPDTGPSVCEILNRNAVFLLKRLHQNIAPVGADGTDDSDFALLFSRRQNFLPLLTEA